jgi:SAM-dependent methyltransferase
VVELGCGTAYVSAWLARRGARPVGIDLTEAQLDTARAMQVRFGPRFPLVHGDAEVLPFGDASFDLAISEYGASLWCDPYRWIPEAARVLRPGGELTFLTNGTIAILAVPETDDEGPADERLKRDYFGLHRMDWPDEDSVEFHLGYGDWIRVLRANGLEILDMIEVRPPEGATTRYPWVTGEWARRWPVEEIWKARKAG